MLSAWRQLGELPRTVWVLSLACFANRIGTMALPYLVLFLTGPRQLSASQAGSLMAIYGLSALLGNFLAGRSADRYGPMPVLFLSLTSSAVVLCLYPLAQSFATLAVLTAIWSILAEGFRPAAMTAIGLAAPAAARRQAFALMRLLVNLGMSIGPAVGGWLATVSFPLVFVVDGLTCLIAAVVLWWGMPRGSVRAPGSGTAPGASQPLARALVIQLALLCLATVLFSSAYFQCQSTLGLFLTRELQQPTYMLGLVFTINTILIVLTEVPLIARLNFWPHARACSVGAILIGLGFMAHAFAPPIAAVWIGTTIYTVGEMILFPMLPSFLSELAPTGREGRVMGWYTGAWSVAFIIGPWGGLQIYERSGAVVLWLATAAACFLAAILLARLKVSEEARDVKKL